MRTGTLATKYVRLFSTNYFWLGFFIVYAKKDLTYTSATYAGIRCGTKVLARAKVLTVCNSRK